MALESNADIQVLRWPGIHHDGAIMVILVIFIEKDVIPRKVVRKTFLNASTPRWRRFIGASFLLVTIS